MIGRYLQQSVGLLLGACAVGFTDAITKSDSETWKIVAAILWAAYMISVAILEHGKEKP
jgi:hypothetical protein